ncbi:MAG: hypothetical protein ACYTXC_25930 [Nostoc sp.]
MSMLRDPGIDTIHVNQIGMSEPEDALNLHFYLLQKYFQHE